MYFLKTGSPVHLRWLRIFTYGLPNRKPAISSVNIIGLVMNLLMVNGILMNARLDLLNSC